MEDNEYIRLITKHLSREASPEEEADLQRWLEADPGHRLEFDAFERMWRTGDDIIQERSFDTQAAWKKIDPARSRPSFRLLSLKTLAAASVVLALCIAAGWYYLGGPQHQVIASVDNQLVTLSDGSKAWLRKGAQLKYRDPFHRGRREVQLTGEAFFEPVSDPSRPFAIRTPHAHIEDIGTSFLVNDRDSVDEVVVITGKVRFTSKEDPSHSLVVSSGQKATILKNKLSPSEWGTPNMMSWKTGVLEFRQTPLDQVVRDINDHFDSKLTIAPALQTEMENIKVTARFDHQPLDQVLDEIKLATGLQVMRVKDTLLFIRQ